MGRSDWTCIYPKYTISTMVIFGPHKSLQFDGGSWAADNGRGLTKLLAPLPFQFLTRNFKQMETFFYTRLTITNSEVQDFKEIIIRYTYRVYRWHWNRHMVGNLTNYCATILDCFTFTCTFEYKILYTYTRLIPTQDCLLIFTLLPSLIFTAIFT